MFALKPCAPLAGCLGNLAGVPEQELTLLWSELFWVCSLMGTNLRWSKSLLVHKGLIQGFLDTRFERILVKLKFSFPEDASSHSVCFARGTHYYCQGKVKTPNSASCKGKKKTPSFLRSVCIYLKVRLSGTNEVPSGGVLFCKIAIPFL